MTTEQLLQLPSLASGDALSEPLRERLTRDQLECCYTVIVRGQRRW